MRLLFILTELPYPASRNGVALINHELLKSAPAGSCIDLLITGREEAAEPTQRLRAVAPAINDIRFTNEPLSRRYRIGNLLSGVLLGRNIFTQPALRRYLADQRGSYDAFYVAPLMAGLDFQLTTPLFLNAVDSFARFNENAYRRSGGWRDRMKVGLYRAYERRVLAAASLINFVSSTDMAGVRRGNPSLPLINISNGVDSTVFTPVEHLRVAGRLLFTGNFDYAPNAEAARHLVLDIFPSIRAARPDATLHIVGRNPPPELHRQPGVTTTGFVPDIVACYRSAEVFVCPLLSGAGVKNKILEALSAGLPIVTTSLGIDGIEHLHEGHHYLLADEQATFARRVLEVLDDAALRRSLGEHARAVATRHLGWQPIVKHYFDALAQIARSCPGASV